MEIPETEAPATVMSDREVCLYWVTTSDVMPQKHKFDVCWLTCYVIMPSAFGNRSDRDHEVQL